MPLPATITKLQSMVHSTAEDVLIRFESVMRRSETGLSDGGNTINFGSQLQDVRLSLLSAREKVAAYEEDNSPTDLGQRLCEAIAATEATLASYQRC